MIFGIFRSIKKSKKLVKYSQILSYVGPDFSKSGYDLFKSMKDKFNEQDDALQGIIDLAYEDPNCVAVIEKHKITRKKMEDKYRELCLHGAGQVAGNHWVAASALVYPQTLDYIFRKSKKKMTRDSGGVVAYALIEYFEQGKMGSVD